MLLLALNTFPFYQDTWQREQEKRALALCIIRWGELSDPHLPLPPCFQLVLSSRWAPVLWFPGEFPLSAQRAETFRLIPDLSASIIFKQGCELQGTPLLSLALRSLKPLALTLLESGQLHSSPSPTWDDLSLWPVWLQDSLWIRWLNCFLSLNEFWLDLQSSKSSGRQMLPAIPLFPYTWLPQPLSCSRSGSQHNPVCLLQLWKWA